MDAVDILVVGAGVVGLAVAERLSAHGGGIVVVERHDGFGRETSSRNSEVIHAGLYYPESSLKARLCVEGSALLYALCEEQGISYRKTAKMVVANTAREVEAIQRLYRQGCRNGVEELRLLTKEEIRSMEPAVKAGEALFSPHTGIVDSHRLMGFLEGRARNRGVTTAYRCTVTGIARSGASYRVRIRDVDGEEMALGAGIVINAAGLCSDVIAEMAGIPLDEAGYRIRYCKGEYFSVAHRHRHRLSHLVYPVPDALSVGIHTVIGLDGSFRIGPNAFYTDTLAYDVDPDHRDEFYDGARRYLPFIRREDLSPAMAGIRPKLQKEGESFHDFIIREESGRGLSGLINLIGIESPGLTSCLAIARMVEAMLY